jgi:hypothetical protein
MTKNAVLVFFLIISSLHAAGETGLAALKIGAGARATAMGEAFVAIADDASGLFWNPAGSVWMNKRQAHFTYNSWIQGIQHSIASMTTPTRYGSFGFGLMLNSIDGFERRTIASEEPLGTFSAHDFSLLLNYSRQVRPDLSLGINFKYLNEKIYLDNANGYMVDLGVRYQAPVPGLFLAASLQNFGFSTQMAQEKIRLPRTLRLGAAYRLPFKPVQMLVAMDYVQVVKEASYVNIGAEVLVLPALALRLGYQTGFEEKDLSAGFGVNIGRVEIDYAYVPFGRNLGDAHRFSLTLAF